MEYVAGWDGGGTKTICEVRGLEGGAPLRFAAGPLNPNGNTADQADATAAALLARMAELPGGLAGCRMLCIGAAGISNPDTEQRIHITLEKGGYHGSTYFTGDQQTALYGALGGPGGAVLIAGTGSICYGQSTDGREARTGGWGSLMDDEGGGYAIGRDVLAAVVRAEDGRGPATCLTRAVFEVLRVGNIGELIRAVYAPGVGKKEIAALSRLMDEALERKDAAALKICGKAAAELSLLVRPVVEKLGLQGARLALAGSILTRCTPVREAAVTAIAETFPGLSCVAPSRDAASGAALLAEKMLKKKEMRRE